MLQMNRWMHCSIEVHVAFNFVVLNVCGGKEHVKSPGLNIFWVRVVLLSYQ